MCDAIFNILLDHRQFTIVMSDSDNLNELDVASWWPFTSGLTVVIYLHSSVFLSLRTYVYVFPFFLFASVFPYLSLALVFILTSVLNGITHPHTCVS